MGIETALLIGAAFLILGIENFQLRRQVSKATEMLAARSYPEYQSARRLESEPRKLSVSEREKIAYEEQLRRAELDPYSQA